MPRLLLILVLFCLLATPAFAGVGSVLFDDGRWRVIGIDAGARAAADHGHPEEGRRARRLLRARVLLRAEQRVRAGARPLRRRHDRAQPAAARRARRRRHAGPLLRVRDGPHLCAAHHRHRAAQEDEQRLPEARGHDVELRLARDRQAEGLRDPAREQRRGRAVPVQAQGHARDLHRPDAPRDGRGVPHRPAPTRASSRPGTT